MLNEMQKDVLTELVNVYVGQAAHMLSEMVSQRIDLTIPEVELLSISDVHPTDRRFTFFFREGHLITSSLKFGHEFNGKASLLIPADQAKMLVSVCLGELPPEAGEGAESMRLVDTDLDVLKEISNVILNAIIGEFGNFLELKLEYTLPDIELVHVTNTDESVFLQHDVYVLILHTSFQLAETKVKGVIIIALSMNSITTLVSKIDELLEESYG
ncbi:chemotaxis protein CheC [Paenibacillus sp.]|uniref:chemotaxis protein CheC n=1 Tax=Paenibacillus sp. TaxID=58172 RepID=UPI002D475C01|nr:chemotaxis protein CheC [Paenibacillus sp.]HZG58372.1 chemotaxis protein CheC [Paenibacillus sp.]